MVRVLSFVTFLILFSSFFSINDWKDKIDSDVLLQFQSQEFVEYIIFFRDKADLSYAQRIKTKSEKANFVYEELSKIARISQKETVELLSDNNIPYKSYFIVNAIKVISDISILETIVQNDKILEVKPNPWFKSMNYIIDKPKPISIREVEPEWGIKMINADSLWKMGFTGQDIVIAGQDTGYDWDVSPLVNKYRGVSDTDTIHDYNWFDAISEISPLSGDSVIMAENNPCGLKSPFPCDDNNHGTHTMGTMVGQDENNSIGVAPGAQWIGCRNMERGNGKPSTYLDCFQFFLAPTDLNGENPDVSMAPDIINNSWFCSESEGCNIMNWGVLEEIVNNLKASGIFVVVSAGNNGPNCNTVTGPPAIFESSFSVGATASNDTIASFSSRGLVSIDSSFLLKPNVSAPGQGVRSVIRTGGFANFSGTSMAGPHVAGAAALLMSAFPELRGNVEEIENILEATAIPKFSDQICDGIDGQTVPNPVYGYGRIDVLKAFETLQLSQSEDELIDSSFEIYPNPFQNYLHIRKRIPSDLPIKIELFTDTGQLIYSDKFTTEQLEPIDVSFLRSGVYLVTILSDDIRISKKIVKL